MTYPLRNIQTIVLKSWYVNVEDFYHNIQKLLKNKDNFFRYNVVLDTSHSQEMFEVEGMDESDYNSSKHLMVEEMEFLVKKINEEIEEHNNKIGCQVLIFKQSYDELNITIPELAIREDRDYGIKRKMEWKGTHFSEGAPLKRRKR